MRQCPNCGTFNSQAAQFCETCGTALQNQPVVQACPQCGQPVPVENRFCENCGYQFGPQPPVQPEMVMPAKSKRPLWPKLLVGIIAILIILGGGYGWFQYQQAQTTARNEQRAAAEQASRKRESAIASAKAASSSLAAAQSEATADSVAAKASSMSASSESVAALARSMRGALITDFDCEPKAVAKVPDKEIVADTHASEDAGEDIAGFYQRVKAHHPAIGGSLTATTAADDDETDEE